MFLYSAQPFDAIPIPPLANIFGHNWPRPVPIDDHEQPLLIRLSELALEKYNKDNQVLNYLTTKPISVYIFIQLSTSMLFYFVLFRVWSMSVRSLSRQPLVIFLLAATTLPSKQHQNQKMFILPTCLLPLSRPTSVTVRLNLWSSRVPLKPNTHTHHGNNISILHAYMFNIL